MLLKSGVFFFFFFLRERFSRILIVLFIRVSNPLSDFLKRLVW